MSQVSSTTVTYFTAGGMGSWMGMMGRSELVGHPQAWSAPPPTSGAWKQSPVLKEHIHIGRAGLKGAHASRNCLDIWGRRPSV